MAAATQGGRRRRLQECERTELREAFELFDSEKRGVISLHELKVLMRALGFSIKKAELAELVGDRPVDLALFSDLMAERYEARDPDEEIAKAFDLFDTDSTGKISLKNVQTIAAELGENMTPAELQLMIDEFDTDLDGHISQDEFLAIMRQGSDAEARFHDVQHMMSSEQQQPQRRSAESSRQAPAHDDDETLRST